MTERCEGARNAKVVEFLKKPENTMLLNSYIAYLAIYDLNKIAKLTEKELALAQSEIDSEKELAYFEHRKAGTNSLFTKERLKEFFPRYSSIEYVFTGLFVHNLIWPNMLTGRS